MSNNNNYYHFDYTADSILLDLYQSSKTEADVRLQIKVGNDIFHIKLGKEHLIKIKKFLNNIEDL